MNGLSGGSAVDAVRGHFGGTEMTICRGFDSVLQGFETGAESIHGIDEFINPAALVGENEVHGVQLVFEKCDPDLQIR